jgi:hypothetical protein
MVHRASVHISIDENLLPLPGDPDPIGFSTTGPIISSDHDKPLGDFDFWSRGKI